MYSPLDRLVLKLTQDGFDELANHVDLSFWKQAVDPDSRLQLFEAIPPPKSKYISQNKFDGVVFLVTNACNLACRYCYAEKTHVNLAVIEEDVWKRALDYVFQKIDQNSSEIGLAFHGYGECSLYPDLIINITREFQARCNEAGLNAKFQITTNGTFSRELCDFLIDNKFFINMSLDGPASIHNVMRKTKDGEGSFFLSSNNLDHILGSDMADSLMIRSTYTPETIDFMKDAFEYYASAGVKLVHMEPAYMRGAAESLSIAPDYLYKKFIQLFMQCIKLANKNNMKIHYGPINFGLGRRFCSHEGKLMVDFEGRIVSCVEAGTGSGLDQLHYGELCGGSSACSVKYDGSKIDWLNSVSVDNYKECSDCLLKYHCAGNCLVSRILNWDDQTKEAACGCNENLFANLLLMISKGDSIDSVLDFPLHRVW